MLEHQCYGTELPSLHQHWLRGTNQERGASFKITPQAQLKLASVTWTNSPNLIFVFQMYSSYMLYYHVNPRKHNFGKDAYVVFPYSNNSFVSAFQQVETAVTERNSMRL